MASCQAYDINVMLSEIHEGNGGKNSYRRIWLAKLRIERYM